MAPLLAAGSLKLVRTAAVSAPAEAVLVYCANWVTVAQSPLWVALRRWPSTRPPMRAVPCRAVIVVCCNGVALPCHAAATRLAALVHCCASCTATAAVRGSVNPTQLVGSVRPRCTLLYDRGTKRNSPIDRSIDRSIAIRARLPAVWCTVHCGPKRAGGGVR